MTPEEQMLKSLREFQYGSIVVLPKSQWIPIAERLPESGRSVPIVFISLLDGQPAIGAVEWDAAKGDWYDGDERRFQATVTHWLDVYPPVQEPTQ